MRLGFILTFLHRTLAYFLIESANALLMKQRPFVSSAYSETVSLIHVLAWSTLCYVEYTLNSRVYFNWMRPPCIVSDSSIIRVFIIDACSFFSFHKQKMLFMLFAAVVVQYCIFTQFRLYICCTLFSGFARNQGNAQEIPLCCFQHYR